MHNSGNVQCITRGRVAGQQRLKGRKLWHAKSRIMETQRWIVERDEGSHLKAQHEVSALKCQEHATR